MPAALALSFIPRWFLMLKKGAAPHG
jgi:hypothetical protein